ncbi:hypothetical protein HDV06_007066 [Boothiomyces sp. JEL0866]|nr:hypothetical protein HDV06_007066 [Boothiomyces sp. JEL0866]
MIIFLPAAMAATFNGINFAVKNGMYTSDSCAISDTEFQTVNATSASECATKCTNATQVLPGGGFNCTSFTYNTDSCQLYDRSINLLSLFSSGGNSCGFILNNNPYCKDNQESVFCDIPNNTGKTIVGAKEGIYLGTKFNTSGDVYTRTSCRTNQLFIAGPQVKSFEECVSKCQSTHACTAFTAGNISSSYIGCYMYDKPLNQLSFNTERDVSGYNCGFLLSRTIQCYNDGTNIICQDAFEGPTTTTASSPSATSSISEGTNPPASKSTMILFMVPGIIIILAMIVFGVYFYRKRKPRAASMLTFKSTPIASNTCTYIETNRFSSQEFKLMSTDKRVSKELGELPIIPKPYIPEINTLQPPILQAMYTQPLHVGLEQQPRTVEIQIEEQQPRTVEIQIEEQPPILMNKGF